VHRTRRDVAAFDQRPEREVTRGDGDGAGRTERVRAPMERSEVGGNEPRRRDGDGDRAEPQDHGAR
jgi:hypothetical protein